MRITCPECQSGFDVPLALIGTEGRKVRCASESCRHVWVAMPPPVVETTPQESPYTKMQGNVSATGFEIDFDLNKRASAYAGEVKVEKKDKKGTQKENALPSKVLWATRLASAAAMIVLLGLPTYFLRDTIVDILPKSALFYKGLGVDVVVAGEGAGIEKLVLKPVWTPKGATIEVTTRVLNLTDTPIKLAPIVIEAIDEKGTVSGQTWRFAAPKGKLAKGETLPFAVKLENIKATGESLKLRARFES